MLSYQLGVSIGRETSMVIDFSQLEEEERQLQEQMFKENISKKIDDLLAASRQSGQEIRNIAVNASSTLKDDRNTDVDELYKEAERVAQELKNNQNSTDDLEDEVVDMSKEREKEEKAEETYKGPSVLSYNLDGREATYLPKPAYKCYSGGDVTVIIEVDRAGKVLSAKVLEEVSSSDDCLKQYAIRAARMSKFEPKASAPQRQAGEILYRFIAQ